ncbi:MAG: alpha-galactosidase [Puniceicoccaceae bacterium]
MKIHSLIPKLFITFTIVLASLPVLSKPTAWKGITVDVDATHPVKVVQKVSKDANGFHRLGIKLSNAGSETLTINNILVRIPLKAGLSDKHEVIYGSSCMGRRPLLREAIGSKGNKSYSYMYEMVKVTEGDYVFAGSLSWRIFLPVFTVESDAFLIESKGEGKQLKPGQQIDYEQIVLTRTPSWLSLLNDFGDAIAAENGIKQVKDVDFKGWATWDYYGRLFSKEDILGNMDAMNKVSAEANLIQIDGGWWTERGDYMKPRDSLPGGIKAIAKKIAAEGKTPGLHFDGFRADGASEIYKSHPEYFLHDQDGNVVMEVKQLADRQMNYIYFDYSNPDARAYIQKCVKTMRGWGIRYFKVDFMRFGIESEVLQANPGVKKIVAHDPSITGIERFRLGMQAIRDAIGEENYFLGCSAVFGPCIGFVDGMRTGGDVHPRYEAFPERCLANTGNFYLARTVYNGDCDYLVFREAADEDESVFKSRHKFGGSLPLNEAQMWADYNKLYGNCRLASDNLMTLRPERQALVREVFEWEAMDKTVPLDVWEQATDKLDGFEMLLARKGDDIYLGLFNWADASKSYKLSGFGLKKPVEVEGRHSVVLKYDGDKSFDQLSELLKTP